MRVVAIAGFDPSGRAGLLADTWAIGQSDATPLGVITAITAQGATFSCDPVDPALIRRQLRAIGTFDAAKLGMIPHRAALTAIVAELKGLKIPIVIDPVVRTSKGEPLSTLAPGDYLKLGKQLKRAILTPNLAELEWLGASATDLLDVGFVGVIVKGSDSATDVVFSPSGKQTLRGSRLPRSTSHHRGTGCRFGSGLAASLARGEDLARAARSAKRLVRKFLRAPIIP